MVETISPVVHGARTWLISLLAFSAGAVTSGALLGLALGLLLPTAGAAALVAVALLAGLYALRELGLVRLGVPQRRAQVPEIWRERYPQPVAALLYGLGLGVGFGTYMPVATLMVVAAGVVAFAAPAAGAFTLAAFGLGRALVLVASTRGLRSYEGATGRIEGMAGWASGGRLRRLNAAALAGLGAVLMLAALGGTAEAATRVELGSDRVADPSPGPGDVLAFNRVTAGGVVQGRIRVDGAIDALAGTHPDVDGERVVVDTGPGFEIIDYRTGTVLETLPLLGTDPALSGGWLVYRRRTVTERQVVLRNLASGEVRILNRGGATIDLGPPDISGPRVVWTRTGPDWSNVLIYRIDLKVARPLRRETRTAYSFASVGGTVVSFVRQTLSGQQLVRVNTLDNRLVLLHSEPRGRGVFLWSTAVVTWRFFFTRYTAAGSGVYRP